MKRNSGSEFIFQLFALILSVIIIHAVYVALIRPNANAILQTQLDRQAAGETYVVQRSLYVVMRDFEQEACFVLMLWAMAIMGYKTRRALTEREMLNRSLLQVSENTPIIPSKVTEYTGTLKQLSTSQQVLLLPRTLLTALHRFGATQEIGDASRAVRENCDTESERLDSELSMVRYIAWAIPSIGFIGTVRGIGEALGQAHRAVEGDIAGVTISLGVAFNSTFIALVISIVIMFFVHQLQLLQERLVLDTQDYCDSNLLRHLRESD